MKRILILLSISFSLPAAERTPQPPAQSYMDLLPPDLQWETFKYASWGTLEEALKGIEGYYTALPAGKNNALLTQKILTHIMQKFNFTKGKELQDVIERLEKLGGMLAFKNEGLKKWIGQQKKRLFLSNELRDAVSKNDADKVDSLIAKGADVNAKDKEGFSAIQYFNFKLSNIKSVQDKKNRILLSLLNAGVDPNVTISYKGYLQDTIKRPLLYWAIQFQDAASVQTLLEKNAIVNDFDLGIAAIPSDLRNDPEGRKRYKQIIRMLLEKGANPNTYWSTIKFGILRPQLLSEEEIKELLDLMRKHGLKE